MTYGLNVFKANSSALDDSVTAQRATWSAQTRALVDAAVAADNAGALSSRAAVYDAFENIATSPGIPTETEVRNWMLTGIGANKSTFKATYDYQYANGTGTKTAAAVQAEIATRRYPNFNTLSPYPFYQSDNQITTPSLSTQDAYGNNKTILFLAISDKTNFTWDYATAAGLTYNSIINQGQAELNQSQQIAYAAIIRYDLNYGSRSYISYRNKWNNPLIPSQFQLNLFPSYSKSTPGTSGYTYEVWTFPTLRNTKSTLFCMSGYSGAQDVTYQPKFHIYLNSGGYVVWDTLPFSPHSSHISSSAVPLGAWTLVTCMYDGTTKRIYLNGILAGEFSRPSYYNAVAMVSSLDRNFNYYGGPWTQYNQTIQISTGNINLFSAGDVIEFYGEGFSGSTGVYIRDGNYLTSFSSCIIQSVSVSENIIQLYGYINYFDGPVQEGIYIRKANSSLSTYSTYWRTQDFGDIAHMGGDQQNPYRYLYIGKSDNSSNDTYTGLMGQIRITPDKYAYKPIGNVDVATSWSQSGNQTESASRMPLSNSSIVLTWSNGTYYVGLPNTYYTNFDWSNISSLNNSTTEPIILGTAYFNGVVSACEIVPQYSSNWNFSSGTPFTIEFYLYASALPTSYVTTEQCLLSYTNGSGGELWGIYLGPYPNFITVYNNGTSFLTVPLLSGSVKLYNNNTLYHIALNCTGSTIKLFVNGVQKAINSNFSGFGTYSSGGKLMVGGPAKLGNIPARSNCLYYTGYLASLRTVIGKSIYTVDFPQITRKTATSRTRVIGSYAANKLAALYPDELSVQYWMLNGIAAGNPVKVYSTNDITWNQVYNEFLPKDTEFPTTVFTSCIGRTISVIQNLIDSPTLTTTYTVGQPVTNSAAGSVQIPASTVGTYVTILMR